MSEDEGFVLITSAVVAAIGWGQWVWRFLAVRGFRPRSAPQTWLLLAPVWCLAALFPVLRMLASFDVQGSPTYLAFYMLLGAAWIAAFRFLYTVLGVSWIGDVVERRNPAAVWAIFGALAGTMACYAGANVGDGPGWWCVIVAGGLAMAVWIGSWLLAEKIGGYAESVTVERDTAAGIRFGFFLLSSGLICGRSAAGDWTSLEQTVTEFLVAWPVVVMALAAGFVERWMTRPDDRGIRAPGSAPLAVCQGLLYVVVALAVVMFSPPLSQNPQYEAGREQIR